MRVAQTGALAQLTALAIALMTLRNCMAMAMAGNDVGGL